MGLSLRISKQILSSDVYQKAQHIMIYKAVKGEVDLSFLEENAQKSGKKLYYPSCISKTEMISLSPGKDLPEGVFAWEKGAFGIMEPVREYSDEILPEKLDLVICPCTGFDEYGGRMGMGAGYYDRFLPKCTKAYIISVAFEIQKIPQVPMDIWDIPMDMIFTEKNIYLNNFN
jgi:5-formyltetrahydrofolate cyclo-ligase